MGYHERINLGTLVSGVLVLAWYSSRIWPQWQAGAVEAIEFRSTMMVAIGIGIVLSIVSAIFVSVGTAAWTGIREGADAVEAEMESEDERDRQVSRLGDAWGGHVLSVAVIGALVLIWQNAADFWIANVLFLGAWISAMLGGIAKLIAYRRGL